MRKRLVAIAVGTAFVLSPPATGSNLLASESLTTEPQLVPILPCTVSVLGSLNCLSDVDPSEPLDQRLPLILVHGWNDESIPAPPRTAAWDNFLHYFRNSSLKAQYKPYYFSYFSNDISVFDLGGALRDVLDIESTRDQNFGNKPVVIIAHSMGGLVARSFAQQHRLTKGSYAGRPGGDRTRVLITLGTPHHGSPLANEPARDSKAGIVWAARFQIYELFFSKVNFDEFNRSDFRWDNYDGLLNYARYFNEENSWLAELNQNRDFDGKIIAYAGIIAPSGECFPERGIPEILLNPVAREAAKFCLGSTAMGGAFGLANDGVVPLASAFFYGPSGRPRVATRYFPDYDHTQIRAGKGNNLLFDRIAVDLDAIIGSNIRARVYMAKSEIDEFLMKKLVELSQHLIDTPIREQLTREISGADKVNSDVQALTLFYQQMRIKQ